MDVTFVVSIAIFILFISLILVSTINYFTRVPESAIILELRDKVNTLFNTLFGSRGVAISERMTVDLFRVPILLEEKAGKNWTNEIVGVTVNFDEVCNRKQSWNNSVRVYDQQFVELPSKISYQEFCTSQWLNNSVVTFVINLTANQTKRVYVYSINNTNTIAPSHNIMNITGLVGYWNFDDISGTLAKDFSTNQKNGALTTGVNCSTSIEAKFGNACKFDGIESAVNVSSFYTQIPIATWMLWVKFDSVPSSWVSLLDAGEIGSFGVGRDYIAIKKSGVSEEGLVAHINTVGMGNRSAFVTTGIIPITNSWHHIAATYDGATLRIYVNGTLRNSTITSGSIPLPSLVAIGNRVEATDETLNGTIDDVRIYNRVLTADEISALASTIPSATIFPAEIITAISAEKVQTLKGRTYEDVKGIVGEGFDFRIEIREK